MAPDLKPVLGIETSCDETAAAVVTADKRILSSLVLSQDAHKAFGGVVPEVAARAHLDHVDTLIEAAMAEAGLDFKDLGGIAVTAGPGLIGGVLVGSTTAKAIAAVHDLPLVAVNHLEGHALTARLTDDIAFPFLLLLVSGGHSQILAVEGVGKYKRLGTTIDDAAGECFDKTAKILGLGWPGGPALERKAAECTDPAVTLRKFSFPKPFFGKPGCDFSFSGLKTAAKRMAEKLPPENGADPARSIDVADFCFAFQETMAAILADRMRNAIKIFDCKGTLVVSGGVAANRRIRAALETVAAENAMAFVAPPLKLCTDNAAMIAWAGIERLQAGLADPPDFPVRARWPLDPDAPVACAKSQKI
jgi:N6-L-threonylcarbamoyladenine synthase